MGKKTVLVRGGKIAHGASSQPDAAILAKFGMTAEQWSISRETRTVELVGIALDDDEIVQKTLDAQMLGHANEEEQKQIVMDTLFALTQKMVVLSEMESALAGKLPDVSRKNASVKARIAYILSEIPDQ